MVLSRGWLYYAMHVTSIHISIIILIVIDGRLASSAGDIIVLIIITVDLVEDPWIIISYIYCIGFIFIAGSHYSCSSIL